MTAIHRWIESKTGVLFGYHRTRVTTRPRVLIRLGKGNDPHLCMFEAGTSRRFIWADWGHGEKR